MPPKKAVKGKRKKKKTGEQTELTVEDKYKRTMEEIECLKVELATRTEHSRRSRDMSARMKEKMLEAKGEVEQEQQDKMDISSDLTRQYKMMQSELGLKIHILEQNVTTLRAQLASTEADLAQTKKERDDIRKEKDEIIAELQFKIDTMESAYETLLHDTLDKMGDKVEEAKKRWLSESHAIQETNKQLLFAFGLNPLEI